MGFAVYHTEKGKISSGGIGKHIDREKGAEHSYQHSDPNRRHLNKNYIINEHCKKELSVAISDRIKEGYSATNKAGELKQIRKDAVKYSTHIFSGTHEDMKRIESNPKELEKWVQANLKFTEQEFGKDNIVRFTLHMDEKTPHIHAVTVNLTQDGRLSAKEIIGNKKQMQERQDRYAEAMKEFGLERGVKREGVKHEDAKEYYARINASLSVDEPPAEAKRGIFGVDLGIDKAKTIERLSSENKALKTANKAKEFELDKIKKREAEAVEFKNKVVQNNKNLSSALSESLLNPEYRDKLIIQKTQEIGKKYGYDVQNKFAFLSNSIQKKNNDEIRQMVNSAVMKVGQEKNLTKSEIIMLGNSNEVKYQYEKLVKERDRRNDLDRGQGWSR